MSTSFIVTEVTWAMMQALWLECCMTSVERVLEYGQLDSEGRIRSRKFQKWPIGGEVHFEGVSLSYNKNEVDDGNKVLKGVSFRVKGGERVQTYIVVAMQFLRIFFPIDWHCWKDWSREVLPGLPPPENGGALRRKDLCRRPGHWRHGPPRGQESHSTDSAKGRADGGDDTLKLGPGGKVCKWGNIGSYEKGMS